MTISTEVIIALAIGAVGLMFSMVSGIFHVLSTMRLDKYQGELQAKQRQQTRFENVEELMGVYKKPLVESANELQLRLSLLLLSNRPLTDREDRQLSYMLHSTLYLFSAFLGWLEVIRQEIVFITGRSSSTLNEILDAIKFQFTGETVVQGFPRDAAPKSLEYSLDNPWHVLQLYHVELRAIGEVMLSERAYDNDKKDIKSTNLAVIGYAEFVRRFTVKEPVLEEFTSNGGDYAKYRAAKDQWDASKEKLLQHHLLPLTRSIQRWMEMEPEERPKERITMLQVLLCKLIDFLDDGEKSPNTQQDEERFLPRSEWLNPLLDHLRRDALIWLWDRPFITDCVPAVDPTRRREWLSVINSHEPWRNSYGEDIPVLALRKLAFPGFREDLKWTGRSMGSPYLAGAFPPKIRQVTFFEDPTYYLQVNAPQLWARLTCGVVQDGGPLRDPFHRDPARPSMFGAGLAAISAFPATAFSQLRPSAVPPLSPPPPAHPRPLYLAPLQVPTGPSQPPAPPPPGPTRRGEGQTSQGGAGGGGGGGGGDGGGGAGTGGGGAGMTIRPVVPQAPNRS